MKKITINITDEQEKFLKLFAAKHYPGADDNLLTNQPIHVVQDKRYSYIPYSADIEEHMDGLQLVFSYYNNHWYDSETELVRDYYKDNMPTLPIKEPKSFKELQYQRINYDDKVLYITDYKDYFEAHGVKDITIAWRDVSYDDIAFFFILEEARRYMQYQKHNLKEPRTYTFSAGYSNKGEYHHFWELLFNIGKQLNKVAEEPEYQIGDIHFEE
ncbi:hypothetical protein [Pelotomaculum propionicicum]|uniref:Uncharacterized protein n=1 Tax=Pelotomaculum propionicicum TaxID=258475 RepID=A0A4Y7RKV9_9FIRM|nr:hypothetical protein [Pelotomaculum propionicicum]TEB09322.1 hypothetical protein Pmgp_03254 [Pelotomaculum propionicicum]